MSYSSEAALTEANESRAPVEEFDAKKAELDAFEKATNGLIENQSKEPGDQEYIDAIDLNRRLWRTLESDLASRENQLPDALKAKLISVAMWVERHSTLVEQGEARVDSLIEVNQSIIKGLEASSALG